MNLESRLININGKNSIRKSEAYIMVEVLVYLMIASIILVSIGIIFRSSISIKNSIISKIEMRGTGHLLS